ncbi:MAG TPA: hypothetical protein VEJ44_00045 [Acidimicrobiales bacterium]|nr:hypothetical protein [Acidimicrobiales bacterium]
MTSEGLRHLCEAAARGRFPDPDWKVDVVPSPPRVVAAVVGFTAHHVVATDLGAGEVEAHLDRADPAAPMNVTFLHWLGDRVQAHVGNVDVVLAAQGTGNGDDWLRPVTDPPDSEWVRRARRQRAGVLFLSPPDGGAVVTLGAGLADRCELSVEIDGESDRGAGLGARLLRAALGHVDAEQAVFAAVAPGNTRSLRCFLAAGFAPIGAECVLVRVVA